MRAVEPPVNQAAALAPTVPGCTSGEVASPVRFP